MVATIEGPMTTADQLSPASDELARVVKARAKLGYEIESLTETRAVLVTKGPKRMFGMRSGDEQRTEIVINDAGKAVSRRI